MKTKSFRWHLKSYSNFKVSKNFFEMEACSNQASQSMPHFPGLYRQRRSGFGALAAGIGRIALQLARVSRSCNQKNVSKTSTGKYSSQNCSQTSRWNIVIPSEATHSSLDLFENTPLLLTFDQSFEQKTGQHYSPAGSSLEFAVVGDRNSFIDLHKIYVEIKCRILQTNGTDLRHTLGDADASGLQYFLIISFIRFLPTVLFLLMVCKFQQLMDTMHTKVS